VSLNQAGPDSEDSKVVLSGGVTSSRKSSLGTIDPRRVPSEETSWMEPPAVVPSTAPGWGVGRHEKRCHADGNSESQ
jgi:hypothetical protein